MGMEISGAELVQAQVKDGAHVIIDNVKPDQGSIELEEPIKFGAVDVSHGMKNAVPKGEGDPAVDSKFPKDAADEWPAPKQIHYFYFVRFRAYEDPKLRSKYEQTEKEIENKSKARVQLMDMLKAKRSDRAAVIAQLKPLTAEDKQYRMMLDGKRKELEPLQAALGKLRSASYTAREKGVSLCSSEEALNDLIASLHYRMQHESNTLAEEKQLLKEIKQLEGTRVKVIANDAMKAKIQDSLGQKEAIQDQVKLIGGDLDGVRREQQEVRKKIKHLEEELKAIDTEISSLREELEALNQKKDKAYDIKNELRKAREERNSHFYQNRSILNHAKDLAAKKDIAALEELSHAEMEKFMSLWSSDKAFRDDYEKRILPSLDIRQLSRDGRMRNPDEKPLVLEVLPPPIEPVTAPGKVNTTAQLKVDRKRTKEDVKPLQEPNTVSNSTARNEGRDEPTEVQMKGKGDTSANAESFSLPEKTQKETLAANGIDPIKLKEIKREEEMAKAKLASERKKKLAEKAAERAAKKFHKEAERKLKEREKRAKKKAGASIAASDAEQVEAETNDADPEKTEVNMEPPVPAKIKEQKENVRHRKPKGQVPLPKVILGKKKSQSYWVWAVPATVIALMLAIFAYYYVL
ncbi:hypothetical protein MRB53_015645 [Persea americana]|uniref:Uncharacterized protein n=1 Tax=Persea americana TaxID=3435 RepID=A0ACC2LZN4_PERAE|nr:hypothetical protein MRB53_015645 [Persea americana]|eukprot:TRINITY_DN258_c1_g1_i3.p1 TRINITY_DN258_c1_g1~~TRINITY_DN258_c1_g1_i3.p1  ORF type:complete len:634 (-),score=195.55 TRINITY_DN258_c1_g1_i3:249-2150(-)